MWELEEGQEVKRLLTDLRHSLAAAISAHRLDGKERTGQFDAPEDQAAAVLVLVISAVFGHGIVNTFLPDALGLDNDFYRRAFVGWLADFLSTQA